MARCRSYASLEEHARSLGEDSGLERESEGSLLDELVGLAGRALLLPARSLFEGQAAESPEPPPASSLGIVTANRVESAHRALESYIDAERGYGRSLEWAVYDDSPQESIRGAYREMLSSLATRRGAELRYAGEEEKRAFAAALEARGIRREDLDFCLFGPPELGPRYGANRNSRYLDCIGELGLEVDDDTVCELGGSVELGASLAFIEGDPTTFLHFRSLDEARASVRGGREGLEGESFAAIHEALLGRGLRACAAKLAGRSPELALGRMNDRIAELVSSGEGRVVATYMGIAGDSGMSSAFPSLLVEGDSRESLLGDEPGYLERIEGRAVVRMAEASSICDRSFLMCTAVGFDCRALLPPFIPAMRNEDGLFASLLPIVLPEALIGYLPRSIAHLPMSPRSSSRRHFAAQACGWGCIDLMIALAKLFPANCLPKADAAGRLRALGRHFVGIGRLDRAELEELALQFYLREKASLAARIERLLREYDRSPADWASDLDRCLEALYVALGERDRALPQDLLPIAPRDERAAALGSLIRRYGELLLAWPDIVEAARAEREGTGRRVSAPIHL